MIRSKNNNKLLVIVGLLFAGLIVSASVQLTESFGNSGAQKRKKRNVKEEVLNLVIDAAPDEADAEKKEARVKKNKRFNINSKLPYSLEEHQKDGEYSGLLLETEPPPLPLTSDLIIVGSIQRRQPYLSGNITVVYTELTVHIEEILKNNATSPVYSFEPLIVDREGGAIRMPNGRIFRYLVSHLGIPEAGKRYVLFLQHEAEKDYKLVVGYELTDKTIIPLETFGDRESLLNLTEAQFLSLLKQKISQSQAEKEN